MKPPRVLFYVQYLEGIGHVVRAGRIAEQLLRQGCDVALVLGGEPIPNFSVAGARLHQLTPFHVGPDSYSKLLTSDGRPAGESVKAARRDDLLAIYREEQPDVLITEAYPMGRWAMQFELEPLLESATATRRRPTIVASLRDILQMPKSADKAEMSARMFERYYDAMLIHGDPDMVRIEESFPPTKTFLAQAHYTGIVAPARRPLGADDEPFDVLVSAGGGAIGFDVLAAAIAAKPVCCLADDRWLALAGPRMPSDEFERLSELARQNAVRLERYHDNLGGLMMQAKLSIQRAGYNTAADLMVAGCRSVLVPDAASGQREQPLRAEKLAALGRAVVLPETELTPSAMAAAIDRAMELEPQGTSLQLDGAARSAEIICRLVRDHQLAQNAIELG